MKTIIVALALTLAAPAVLARPDPEQPMETSLISRHDLAYGFTHIDLDSADGERHYRLWIGIPKRPAPATGYPALWMLDGNAALGALDGPHLAALAAGQAPVLVAVGYPSLQRIERTARTFDYTPTVPGLSEQRDPLTGEPSGGVDRFLDLLTGPMHDRVAAIVPIDRQRQTLWGHSYGGLAVLHALFTRPDRFSDFAVASPSLWWHDGAIIREAQGMSPALGSSRPRVLLMRGSEEPSSPRGAVAGGAERPLRELAAALRQVEGVSVQVDRFEGLGHGPMLAASLQRVIDRLSR